MLSVYSIALAEINKFMKIEKGLRYLSLQEELESAWSHKKWRHDDHQPKEEDDYTTRGESFLARIIKLHVNHKKFFQSVRK